jgi:hypothetical protein
LKRSAKDTLQEAADDVAEAVQDVGDEASRAEAGAQPSPQQSDGR